MPSKIRGAWFVQEVTPGPMLNTDIIAKVSRDGGVTKSTVTLTDVVTLASGYHMLVGEADVSGNPSGTSIIYEISTPTGAGIVLRGAYLGWR
ncbi:MAG: hypothetical protein ACYDBB_27055 [Armatimonadota bacterium]